MTRDLHEAAEAAAVAPRDNLVGRLFGRLIVVGLIGARNYNGHRHFIYECRCECGVVKNVTGNKLKSGNTRSCGCFSRERATTHGKSKTRTYKIWGGMIGRCERKTDQAYHYYGARGITVCERWHSFENFLEDMSIRPDGLTLERIDNDKGYSPDNCKWATYAEQALNKRKWDPRKVKKRTPFTHCRKGHPYDEMSVRIRSNGHRSCLICEASSKNARENRAPPDPSDRAERASVEFYGSSVDDPKTGWVTAASLQIGPHTPGIWTVPAVVDDEPEGLAWLPRNAWKTEGDL